MLAQPFFTQCIICGNHRLKELTGYKASYLVKCGGCGFVFSQKIPTQAELTAHYEGYGRNDYLSPITIKRYHEILDQLEKYRKSNRLLDVGCGIGYFLVEAKNRGWEVYGTEYNEKAVDICRNKGIQMQMGMLDTSHYEPSFFDVITSFEVIEHINNPLEDVQKIHYLLAGGGAVYITTPNFSSISKNYLGNKWNVITYPEHLSYYTSATLTHLFKINGFKKINIITTGVSISRIKVSKNQSDVNPISSHSDDEKIRIMAETKWYMHLAKKWMNGLLTLFKKGDTIKAIFVKT
jgi:2-polyprenyl-3-methyl-5-hydroxy-6-metoxy-1,4-benzoquinol methylase